MIEAWVLCLAMNIYFESWGEPLQGMYAVAEVTITRSENSGRNVCQEVFDDRQFSWTLAENPVISNEEGWEQSLLVAKDALDRDTDFSNGATHYHGNYIKKPRWAHKLCETTRIGRHIFYKPCEIPTMMITDRQR